MSEGILKIIRLSFVATLALASLIASAGEDCGTMENELKIANCAESNFKEADAALNSVYGKLIKLLAEPSHLRTAQRAWITFRDADCKHMTQGEFGSRIGFSWYYSCIEQKTRARTEELQKYLGDVQSECSQCPPIKTK